MHNLIKLLSSEIEATLKALKKVSKLDFNLGEIEVFINTMVFLTEIDEHISSLVVNGVAYQLSDYKLLSSFSNLVPPMVIRQPGNRFEAKNLKCKIANPENILNPIKFAQIQDRIAGSLKVSPTYRSFTELRAICTLTEIDCFAIELPEEFRISCEDVASAVKFPVLTRITADLYEMNHFNISAAPYFESVAYNTIVDMLK